MGERFSSKQIPCLTLDGKLRILDLLGVEYTLRDKLVGVRYLIFLRQGGLEFSAGAAVPRTTSRNGSSATAGS